MTSPNSGASFPGSCTRNWSNPIEEREIDRAGSRRIPRWVSVLAWAAVVLGASSIQDLRTTTGGIEIRDKLAHFGEYFVFGWLVARCFEECGWSKRKQLLWTLAFGVFLGTVDELYQGFVPGRERDILDLTADTIGVLAGWYYSREDKAVEHAHGASRHA
ncbi:MAG TPA: VanZ family protein [bacterium]|nr:VanZ family protein [bacterium]